MRVLVFGATGFIGHEYMLRNAKPTTQKLKCVICTFRVALALVRAGHDVYGTTRSAEAAKKLEQAEISPRVVDPLDPSQWKHLIAEMDVVIDAVGGSDIVKAGHSILDTVIIEAKKARPRGPPLSYIYCSVSVLMK